MPNSNKAYKFFKHCLSMLLNTTFFNNMIICTNMINEPDPYKINGFFLVVEKES